MQVNVPVRERSRSRYHDSDSDSGGYVNIPVPLVGGGRRDRRRSPETVYNNAFLIPDNAGPRRRAASTSGAPQPINLVVNPVVDDDRRSRSRRRRDSSVSDRSDRSRRTSRYGIDRQDLIRQLEYEQRRDELRSRSRERNRRRDYDRIEDEIDERRRREKRDRERLEDEIEDRKKKEQRDRERIVAEAKAEEERKKKEQEEYRKKVLEEEAEKEKKKKREKEEHEKEVEEKMRQKFRALGYSESRIDELLRGKREKNRNDREAWAIDLSRPTHIKVNRKYLLPDTLDHYNLPWEWDRHDSSYIIIKRYIDDDFQDVLFEHTKTLKLRRKTITSGYEKDVTVTLRPKQETVEVVKDRGDNMFLVRSKSRGRERSSSRRRSWIFT